METSLTPLIPLRITQASLNQTAFDFPRNLKNIFDAIDEAVLQKSDILTLEELTLTGYDAGDDFQKTDNEVIAELLSDIARYAYAKDPNLIISIGHPWYLAKKDIPAEKGYEGERRKNALYNRINLPFNVQSFIGHGRVLSMTAKNYLYNHGRGYEKRYFSEWNSKDADRLGGKFGTINISIPGQAEPVAFGRPIIHVQSDNGNINLTNMICEEKWVANRYDDGGTDDDYERDAVAPAIARQVGKDGLVIVIADASPPAALKINKHIHLVGLASRYADAVINTDGLGSSGSTFAQHGHRLMTQNGRLISYGERLSFRRVATTSRTIFVSSAATASEANCHVTIEHDFATPQYLKKQLPVFQAGAWDNPQNPALEAEETIRMASLWLFDYMRKTRSQGIVEALSGGMDSAFNSTMVAAMVRLAMTELGVEGFCQEMRHLKYRQDILDAGQTGGIDAAIETCMQHMLTTVYMGTNNSSDATRNAARLLVEGGKWKDQTIRGIGGKFLERNVQDLIDFYATVYAVENTSQLNAAGKTDLLDELGTFFNLRPETLSLSDITAKIDDIKRRHPVLKGEILSASNPRHTLAYENIQARARQALIMMFPNVEGKMAIANPNLDEARNSYATFGGDLHSGTINLNAFINKVKEIQLMQYMATSGLDGIGTFTGLLPVLNNEPSAELLPKDAEGRVIQNDQDALQRSFAQMDRISELMLEARTGINKERRLNPTELYMACSADPLFKTCDIKTLYNMVRLSYQRWWIAQHKIHASPIAPTNDHSVDHQTSLRTPNLSGQDRAQLTQLGIHLLFEMAHAECTTDVKLVLSPDAEAVWQKRAMHDENFVNHFEAALAAGATKSLTFNIQHLYEIVRVKGLESEFGPVDPLIRFLGGKSHALQPT